MSATTSGEFARTTNGGRVRISSIVTAHIETRVRLDIVIRCGIWPHANGSIFIGPFADEVKAQAWLDEYMPCVPLDPDTVPF